MKNVSNTKIILVIAAGLFIGSLFWWIFVGSIPLVSSVASKYLKVEDDPRSQAFLSKVAAELNRSVPLMIDKETELMPTEGVEGMLIYNYRLVSYSAAQIDRNKFAAGAKQRVAQGACNAPETRDGFLKKGVTLRYSYFDKDKQHIATFDVRPSDCGF